MKHWGNPEIMRCGSYWPVIKYFIKLSLTSKIAWWI